MKKQLADNLRQELLKAVPQPGKNRYATGQLKNSIQEVMPYNGNGWIIIIGNGTAQTRSTPSNVYASITNDAKELKVPVGKRGESNLLKIVKNPNYHWATNCIKAWADNLGNEILWDLEEDSEDE